MSFCTKCGKNLDGTNGICPDCEESTGYGFYEPCKETVTPKKYNLFTAYAEMFNRYSEFDGRSSRSEFWYAYLMDFIIYSIFGIIYIVMFGVAFGLESEGFGIAGIIIVVLMLIYALATMIPRIALHIRRLHDTGKSGWFYMLALIPDVGTIIILVLCALETQAGENKYGKDSRYN